MQRLCKLAPGCNFMANRHLWEEVELTDGKEEIGLRGGGGGRLSPLTKGGVGNEALVTQPLIKYRFAIFSLNSGNDSRRSLCGRKGVRAGPRGQFPSALNRDAKVLMFHRCDMLVADPKGRGGKKKLRTRAPRAPPQESQCPTPLQRGLSEIRTRTPSLFPRGLKRLTRPLFSLLPSTRGGGGKEFFQAPDLGFSAFYHKKMSSIIPPNLRSDTLLTSGAAWCPIPKAPLTTCPTCTPQCCPHYSACGWPHCKTHRFNFALHV